MFVQLRSIMFQGETERHRVSQYKAVLRRHEVCVCHYVRVAASVDRDYKTRLSYKQRVVAR